MITSYDGIVRDQIWRKIITLCGKIINIADKCSNGKSSLTDCTDAHKIVLLIEEEIKGLIGHYQLHSSDSNSTTQLREELPLMTRFKKRVSIDNGNDLVQSYLHDDPRWSSPDILMETDRYERKHSLRPSQPPEIRIQQQELRVKVLKIKLMITK